MGVPDVVEHWLQDGSELGEARPGGRFRVAAIVIVEQGDGLGMAMRPILFLTIDVLRPGVLAQGPYRMRQRLRVNRADTAK
jgi:hypothetical protein